MPHQEIAKGEHKSPVLPGIHIGNRGDLVRADRLAGSGEQLAVQLPFDRACFVRRHQLGTGEIGFQELVGDTKPPALVAIEQMVAARDPEITHRCCDSRLISASLRSLSGSTSSSTSMNENALPCPCPSRSCSLRNDSRISPSLTKRWTAMSELIGCVQSDRA